MVGFVLVSYILPGIVFWVGASQSDGLVVNIAIGMFLLIQLAALVGGLVSLGTHRARGVGMLTSLLMTMVVVPTCAFALFFGYCLVALGSLGTM